MKPYIEKNCKVTHNGREFESGGAVVTDDYIIGYMSSDMKKVTTWHGETITERVKVSSSWRVNSWITNKYYQVWAFVDGKWYTGRTAGGGMVVKLKVSKSNP